MNLPENRPFRESRHRWRWGLLGLVVGTWPLTVVRMWRALWTLPSPELLQRERLVDIPTVATFWSLVLASGAELAVLVLLLWPRWERGYPYRLLAASLGTFLWIVVTAPVGITSLQRVHRQWLLLVVALCLAAFLVRALAALGRRISAARTP
jgi:hypothetical protein